MIEEESSSNTKGIVVLATLVSLLALLSYGYIVNLSCILAQDGPVNQETLVRAAGLVIPFIGSALGLFYGCGG